MRVSYYDVERDIKLIDCPGNGKMITIRVMRYSMDGLVLCHVCAFIYYTLAHTHLDE